MNVIPIVRTVPIFDLLSIAWGFWERVRASELLGAGGDTSCSGKAHGQHRSRSLVLGPPRNTPKITYPQNR
eukprot:3006072-Amphidinium_carterae.1